LRRDWLVFAVGAYGAVVATLTGLYQFIRERPGVKVVLTPMAWMGEEADEPVELWEVRVVNHRRRPITIKAAGLLRRRGVHAHGLLVDLNCERVDEPFPVTLADGEAFEILISRDGVFHDAFGAWARDALNRVYRCRYPSLNPRERWATWRERRVMNRYFREREEQLARMREVQ
jgi:hypothetical protein